MVNCSGKSLIPISIDVYQKFMNSVVPSAKLPEFNIKLDAKSNVKASLAKLEGHDLSIHTGAIVNVGSQVFPEISDNESLLMLITIYGVKKASAGVNFEIKTSDAGISIIKSDPEFIALSSQLHLFMDRFRPLNAQALSTPSMFNSVEQGSNQAVVESGSIENAAKTKVPVSPYKNVPLKDTPKIDVPADLDLRLA